MVKSSNSQWFIYLLECTNGKLYTGITTDLEERFKRHVSGRGAKFTKINRPRHIIAAKPCKDLSEASKLEWRIKRLTRAKKFLMASQWPMKEGLPKLALCPTSGLEK